MENETNREKVTAYFDNNRDAPPDHFAALLIVRVSDLLRKSRRVIASHFPSRPRMAKPIGAAGSARRGNPTRALAPGRRREECSDVAIRGVTCFDR